MTDYRSLYPYDPEMDAARITVCAEELNTLLQGCRILNAEAIDYPLTDGTSMLLESPGGNIFALEQGFDLDTAESLDDLKYYIRRTTGHQKQHDLIPKPDVMNWLKWEPANPQALIGLHVDAIEPLGVVTAHGLEQYLDGVIIYTDRHDGTVQATELLITDDALEIYTAHFKLH